MRNPIEQNADAPVDAAPFCTPLTTADHPLTRRAWLGALAAIAGGGALSALAARRAWTEPLVSRAGRLPEMAYVYATPNRTCCDKWCTHLEHNGFAVTNRDLADEVPFKEKFGVPRQLWSCHTALVGNLVIEGHVPADLIHKAQREGGDIAGLSVPGMPCGAPGLEGPNPETYQVIAFTKTGRTFVYAQR